MRATIEESVEVAVPARTAYDQWTQFEDFPRFLDDVRSVAQEDERHLRWRAHVAGHDYEGRTEICEQIPDKRIAWRSLSGLPNAGVLTFHRLSDDRSKVMMQLDYEPEGAVETLSAVLGVCRRQAARSLRSFKEFIEARGEATGSWRGTIPSKDERSKGKT